MKDSKPLNTLLILKERRDYNRWVADQTLEDYALRFTAVNARKWSNLTVSNTALGAISFLALEAIGATITLSYGFYNLLIALILVGLIVFVTSTPISYYAAKYGLDIDLLSRGAGFGYIGSTITSLIYASFTFIFFAIEAAIMASALELLFGLNTSVAYLLSAVVIIPLATYGMTLISRFQTWTLPIWLVLQILPIWVIISFDSNSVNNWLSFGADNIEASKKFDIVSFGAASAILFSLIAQIGEQVDFVRFLPKPEPKKTKRWWAALLAGGPGWIIIGALKIFIGSFLAVLAINHGIHHVDASDPIEMYRIAFTYISSSPQSALVMAGFFVILCQIKINVTNAYAGSIAWSNFFSRLTHNHPGRVVWLVFNIAIALLLMQIGVYDALENTLTIYSTVAIAWVGTIFADLAINKPLGLSPKHIEFKRAYLYAINPVGIGSMLIASTLGILCHMGAFGLFPEALAPYISLATTLIICPLLAKLTRGKYYIARQSDSADKSMKKCVVCENSFEHPDTADCPAYGGTICSLCCALESRCDNICKPKLKMNQTKSESRFNFALENIASYALSPPGRFLIILAGLSGIIAVILHLIFTAAGATHPLFMETLNEIFIDVNMALLIIVGVFVWLYVLATESRRLALEESQNQTSLLKTEVDAHAETYADLQRAKEIAESANVAKSRYLTGISHELRSPLTSIMGYSELIERTPELSEAVKSKVELIRRNSEHLESLIEGLLDISRIEARRMSLHRDTVSSEEMLSQIIQMFSQKAEAKNITFQFSEKRKLPKFFVADQKHLKQILINLLSNAIKYTSHGHVKLAIDYTGSVGSFSVTDTGIGIDPKDLDRIFEPFIRVGSSNDSSGTGLGLTITKFLTEYMGGELSVTSTKGIGTTFRLTILLPSVPTPLPKNTEQSTDLIYTGNPINICTTDDNVEHSKLIQETLERSGFSIFVANDAQTCLEIAKTEKIDLFLLDISMPNVDGWQLAKLLRSSRALAPIIMISADATEIKDNDTERGSALNRVDGYVTKPINTNTLLSTIATALKIELQTCVPKASSDSTDSANVDYDQDILRLRALLKPEQLVQIANYAELGYLQGLNEILLLVKDAEPDLYERLLKMHLSHFRLTNIGAIAKEALSR